jgi:hypothetical protein
MKRNVTMPVLSPVEGTLISDVVDKVVSAGSPTGTDTLSSASMVHRFGLNLVAAMSGATPCTYGWRSHL